VLYKRANSPKPTITNKCTILGFEFLLELAIDQQFQNSLFDDEEAMAELACLKNKRVLIDITIEHFFLDVFEFAF
jgi:hypothetical protein